MCLSWGQSGQEKTVQNHPLNGTQPQTTKVSRLQVNTCPHLLKDSDFNLGLLDASYPVYNEASLRELIKKKQHNSPIQNKQCTQNPITQNEWILSTSYGQLGIKGLHLIQVYTGQFPFLDLPYFHPPSIGIKESNKHPFYLLTPCFMKIEFYFEKDPLHCNLKIIVKWGYQWTIPSKHSKHSKPRYFTLNIAHPLYITQQSFFLDYALNLSKFWICF
jgi:hypothetical protein